MKIPPFRTLAQPSGLPTSTLMSQDFWEKRGSESNLFVDIHTLTYWYYMMCGVSIDIGYVIDGGVAVSVRHHLHVDARKFLPKDRLTYYWSMDNHNVDEELDITARCFMQLNIPHCITPLPQVYQAHTKYLYSKPKGPLLWRHESLPADTRYGVSFKYEEYDEGEDFIICTLQTSIPEPDWGQTTTILDTTTTDFLGQEIKFYFASGIPEEISGHFDFVRVTPEFFEIDPHASPIWETSD